jgi:hypothetical protein
MPYICECELIPLRVTASSHVCPPHNHPRGDKSERYSCSTAYDTAILLLFHCVRYRNFLRILLRTAYVTPKLPGIFSPARLLRFSRVKSEYLLLLPRVYHRAYPRGSSVNDHIPAEWAALEYATVDQSIALIAAEGPGAMLITRDLQDAFRHIPTTQEKYEDRVEERGWRNEDGGTRMEDGDGKGCALLVCLSAPALALYLVLMGICSLGVCRRDSCYGRVGVTAHATLVRGKLVLYFFRGGREGWVEPRAQSCPKAEEWCGRSATSRRNRIAKACRVWISAEDVAVAEKRWGRTGVLNKAVWQKAKEV